MPSNTAKQPTTKETQMSYNTNAHRFAQGSAVYTCRVCDHRTRNTGGDGAGVKLCDMCFDLSGEENYMGSHGGETYNSADGVRAQLAALDKRNGNDSARLYFPDLCESVSY